MYIEQIAAHHDRESFTCIEPEVNDFLRFDTLDEKYGQTWVVVSAQGSDQIIAFYTIDPDPIIGIEDDEYNEYPVGLVRLQMLGVDQRYEKQNIGTRLLYRIIKQILLRASQHSISGLYLTALPSAKSWYMRGSIDFEEASPGSMTLILPVATMRLLPEASDLGLPVEGF